MGLFRKRKAPEARASPVPEEPVQEEREAGWLEADGPLLLQLMAADGVVTEEQALGIPALAGALEFITGIAASVQLRLYRYDAENETELSDDPRLRILNRDTGDLLTGPEWKKAFFQDYILHGRAWAYLNKAGNVLQSLHYVDDRSVNVMTNEDPIFKVATVYVRERAYMPHQFIHMARLTKTGVRGMGLLEQARSELNMALNYMAFENALVKDGGGKRGFLTSTKKLGKDQITALHDQFEALYGNTRKKVVVLNDGVDFKEAQLTSVEMQLSENKQRNREELCSLLCLPPNILTGEATPEEFSRAIRVAVLPLLDAFENAINRAVLLESEKGAMHFSCDTRDLESGDLLKRYNAYTAACRAGWLSKNEIRYKEKYRPIKGLDVVSMSLGDIVYDIPSGQFFVPNTGQAVNMAAVSLPPGNSGEGGNADEN